MRVTNNTTSNLDRFNDGVRPPLDLVPAELASLIRERDRIGVQRQEAETLVRDLRQGHHDQAAEQADAAAASEAARAGKPIPGPAAVRKLEKDREEAARAYDAQSSAFEAVTDEARVMSEDVLGATARDRRADTLAKARTKIEAQANKLADLVDAAVAADAVDLWLITGHYSCEAVTWDVDVVDLGHHNITRTFNSRHVMVRDVIVRAATTVLDEPTN
jgi:hypothetical protein